MNIKYKGALTPVFKHHLKNFLYTHERYVSPEYVLQHDNVTLQLCTETEAVFCVTDKDEDVYDMPKHPFVCLSQWLECK